MAAPNHGPIARVPQRPPILGDLAILICLALALVLLHTLTNGQYGFHRDELDTLDNAGRPAWGYVAYPPLTPFMGRLALTLFGPSLPLVRLPAALAMGAVLVLTGLMARDLGGRRPAQMVAALAAAISPVALIGGVMLHYLSFDYLWWVLAAFCVIRLLHTEDPRWWLGIGAAIGLGMMTKYSMLFFVAGIAVGTLFTPARRYLRSRWLWAGAGLALLIFLPNLIWQLQHNFITLEFLNSIHRRDVAWGRTEGFLVSQLYASANPLTLPIWVAGLIFYFVPAGKRYRMVGWMYITPLLLFFFTQGRFYYLAPTYPMLLAAGAAWGERWLAARRPAAARFAYGAIAVLLLAGSAIAVALSIPLAPINSPVFQAADATSDNFREMIGWPELVQSVADVYHDLPPEERSQAAILTANYGETGAIKLYGPDHDLPEAISGTNSAWARGYGAVPPTTVIAVGFGYDRASRFFASCRVAAPVGNPYGIMNEESSIGTIVVCRDPRSPWPVLWEQLRNFG
ncbi:MAG: glycosyltransferase family 39 protein [Caldilineaceae bacterium]